MAPVLQIEIEHPAVLIEVESLEAQGGQTGSGPQRLGHFVRQSGGEEAHLHAGIVKIVMGLVDLGQAAGKIQLQQTGNPLGQAVVLAIADGAPVGIAQPLEQKQAVEPA